MTLVLYQEWWNESFTVPDTSFRTVNITAVCVVHGNFVFTSRTYCHDHSGHICIPDIGSYTNFSYAVRTGRLVIKVGKCFVYVSSRVTMVPLYFPVLQLHFVAMSVGFLLALDVEPRMVRAGG